MAGGSFFMYKFNFLLQEDEKAKPYNKRHSSPFFLSSGCGSKPIMIISFFLNQLFHAYSSLDKKDYQLKASWICSIFYTAWHRSWILYHRHSLQRNFYCI